MKQNEHRNHVPVLYLQSSMKEWRSFGMSLTNVRTMRHEQIPHIFLPVGELWGKVLEAATDT
jgi:hypothetical protein